MSEDQTTPETVLETAQEWRATLPEDIANHSAIKDIKTVEDLAKSTINAQKMVGADRVSIPAKDAGDEAWSEFYTKLGRPEQSDGYELPTENMPDTLSPEVHAALSSEAHRLGLNKQQYAGLVRHMVTTAHEKQQGNAKAQDENRQAAETELRNRFGSAYDQNLNLAKTAVEKFGGETLMSRLAETGLANDPELIEAFSKIGRLVAEDEVIGGGGGQSFMLSPEEAKSEIDRKLSDPDFRDNYFNGHLPGHKHAVQEMQKLYDLAHG